MGQHDNSSLKDLLTSIRQDTSNAAQKEEFRKKYEQYKKYFFDQKYEKECKIKELETLKEAEGSASEMKELRVKYEQCKINQNKEYQMRKDKEQKLE